jgi:hypothetical protein
MSDPNDEQISATNFSLGDGRTFKLIVIEEPSTTILEEPSTELDATPTPSLQARQS